jgi:hypothetical protein
MGEEGTWGAAYLLQGEDAGLVACYADSLGEHSAQVGFTLAEKGTQQVSATHTDQPRLPHPHTCTLAPPCRPALCLRDTRARRS